MVVDVLVVEDEDDIAVLLVRILELEGYVVARVSTGAEAIERVVSQPPSAVVLDLGLPDMDGIEVCREMRSGGYQGGIIMVTGRASELDRVVGLDVGADDYLVKPFSLAEFQARVRAYFAAAQSRTSVRRRPLLPPSAYGSTPRRDGSGATVSRSS